MTAERRHEVVEFKTERNTTVSDAKDVAMIMKPKHLLLVLTVFAAAAPTGLLAQQHALPGDMEAPLPTGPLSLVRGDEEGERAVRTNRTRDGPDLEPV